MFYNQRKSLFPARCFAILRANNQQFSNLSTEFYNIRIRNRIITVIEQLLHFQEQTLELNYFSATANQILSCLIPILRYVSHPVFTLKSSNIINWWKEMKVWKQKRKEISARDTRKRRVTKPASTTHANSVE